MNRAPTLGEIKRIYKASTTRFIRSTANENFTWQRNYYEHVIRDEQSFDRIRQYILDNPARWDIDRDNPRAATFEPKDAWKTNR
jgi:REP element-mobilizing transposase RayT